MIALKLRVNISPSELRTSFENLCTTYSLSSMSIVSYSFKMYPWSLKTRNYSVSQIFCSIMMDWQAVSYVTCCHNSFLSRWFVLFLYQLKQQYILVPEDCQHNTWLFVLRVHHQLHQLLQFQRWSLPGELLVTWLFLFKKSTLCVICLLD